MNDTRLRIYDRRNKKMLIFDPLAVCCDSDYGGNDYWMTDSSIDIDVIEIHAKDFYSDPMHPTGLKDKNDKEIYEEDILEFRDGDRKVVKFKNGAFNPIPIEPCNEGHNLGYLYKWGLVIGNIYENPELLEVKTCGK